MSVIESEVDSDGSNVGVGGLSETDIIVTSEGEFSAF